ncbi:hypothetical protein ACFL6U_24710 [Planctomycetota bacterium]
MKTRYKYFWLLMIVTLLCQGTSWAGFGDIGNIILRRDSQVNSTTPAATETQSTQRGYYDFDARIGGNPWNEGAAQPVTTQTAYDVEFDFTWNPLSDGETVFQTHHSVSILLDGVEVMVGDLIFPDTPGVPTTVTLSGTLPFSDPVDPEGLYPVSIERIGFFGAGEDSDIWERTLDIGNPEQLPLPLDIENGDSLPSAPVPVPSALILVCTGVAGVVSSRRRWYSKS